MIRDIIKLTKQKLDLEVNHKKLDARVESLFENESKVLFELRQNKNKSSIYEVREKYLPQNIIERYTEIENELSHVENKLLNISEAYKKYLKADYYTLKHNLKDFFKQEYNIDADSTYQQLTLQNSKSIKKNIMIAINVNDRSYVIYDEDFELNQAVADEYSLIIPIDFENEDVVALYEKYPKVFNLFWKEALHLLTKKLNQYTEQKIEFSEVDESFDL